LEYIRNGFIRIKIEFLDGRLDSIDDFCVSEAGLSFKDLIGEYERITAPQYITCEGGVHIAFYPYLAQKPRASLIFIHAGGAHSGAGYQMLASELSKSYRVAVYLMDIRGHGRSEGRRGHTPSVQTVFDDIRRMVDLVRGTGMNLPLFLGGHSSGAGLVLNYAGWWRKSLVDGYFFVSPEFGRKSRTMRANRAEFASVRIPVFILSAMTGGLLMSHSSAVSLKYPQEILASDPMLLSALTRNMALAMTPSDPVRQFPGLDRKYSILVGSQDELIDPARISEFASYPDASVRSNSTVQILTNENHLSILKTVRTRIGAIIRKWINVTPG